jgi:hypothetical protein
MRNGHATAEDDRRHHDALPYLTDKFADCLGILAQGDLQVCAGTASGVRSLAWRATEIDSAHRRGESVSAFRMMHSADYGFVSLPYEFSSSPESSNALAQR